MTKSRKKAAMRPKHPAHPGIEMDAHGKPVPMEDRLAEDRAKAHKSAKRKKKR